MVKLLGDGVLIRFDDRWAAVMATLDLLAALPANGLPTGHAGDRERTADQRATATSSGAP